MVVGLENGSPITQALEPEVFVVPLEGARGLVYSPMTHRACRVDLGAPLEAQIAAARLTGPGIRVDSPYQTHPEEFLPDRVTLFPTNRCGQRCRYCYAQGGLLPALEMPVKTAAVAIDHVIRSVMKLGGKEWVLAFHGGGEPLLRFDWLREVIGYGEEQSAKHGLKMSALSSTGGLIPPAAAEWIAEHFSTLAVSFEVIPEVQNAQRPSAGGRASWQQVHDLLKLFDARGLHYFIRTTVTSANVGRLVETAGVIAAQYGSRSWHVEPMMLEGPLADNVPDLFPDMDEFARSFLDADLRCRELGIQFQCSGTMLNAFGSTFHCGVANDNFAVTPDGCVTACLDVLSADHPHAAQYGYGKITPDGRLEIDHAKRRFLHSIDVRNIPWCQGCFLKFHCSGDCVIRAGQNPHANRDNARCRTNREIAAVLLDRALDGTTVEVASRDMKLSTLY